MRGMRITLKSFQQVEEFVSLANSFSFPVIVGNESQRLSGKDLMGMFSLDYSRPLQVSFDCSDEEYLLFVTKAEKFLV